MASRSFDSQTKICSKHAGDKPIDDKIGLWRDKNSLPDNKSQEFTHVNHLFSVLPKEPQRYRKRSGGIQADFEKI